MGRERARGLQSRMASSRSTDSKHRQHLTKIDLPGCCWIFLFQLPFLRSSINTHIQQPNRMEICEKKSSFCCCRFFRFFPQIEGSLSRHSAKNSLHFRRLRFLNDFILALWGRFARRFNIIGSLFKILSRISITFWHWHWRCLAWAQ